jgi:hypothetical protein
LGVSAADTETLEIFAREIMPAIQHP